VFLPPQLPQKDDSQLGYGHVLMDFMIDALRELSKFSGERSNVVIVLKTMFVDARTVQDPLSDDIVEDELLRALEKIVEQGMIPFFISDEPSTNCQYRGLSILPRPRSERGSHYRQNRWTSPI